MKSGEPQSDCARCGGEVGDVRSRYCSVHCAAQARADECRGPFRDKVRARWEAAQLFGRRLKLQATAEAVGTYPGMVRAIVSELEG